MSGYGANSSASNSASAAAAPVGRISRRLAAKNAGYAEKRVAELEVATALAAQKAAAREARNPVEIARALCNAYLHTHRLQDLSRTLENSPRGTPLQFYTEALRTLTTHDEEIALTLNQERAVRTILLLLIASERGETTAKSQVKIASDKVGSARLEEFLTNGSEQEIALTAERGGLAELIPYYNSVKGRISSAATTHRPNGILYTQSEKLAMIDIIDNLFKPKTTVENIQENVGVIEALKLDERDFDYANTMLVDNDPVAAEIAAEEGGGGGGGEGGEGGGTGAMVAAAAGTAEIDPRAVSIYQFAKYVLIKYGLSPETAEGAAQTMGYKTITYIADGMDTDSILKTNKQTIITGLQELGASEEAANHMAEYFVALLTGAATIEPIVVEGGGEGGMEGGRRRRGSSRKMKSHRSTKSKKARKSKKSRKVKKSKKSRRTHRK